MFILLLYSQISPMLRIHKKKKYGDDMTSHYYVYKIKPLRHQNNNCFSVKHYHSEIITSNNTIIKRVKLSATLAL